MRLRTLYVSILGLAVCGGLAAAWADDKSDLLRAHNDYRAKHCAPALRWSTTLASGAAAWAKKCSFSHASGNFGENLAMGTGIAARTAVRLWYKEVSKYNYSKPGFSAATGHFTQVVWKSSTQLGCGKAMCGGNSYWVCRYAPPGNYQGQFKTNVLKPSC